MTEMLDAQCIYGFRKYIISEQNRGTSPFVEKEDGVLRSVPASDKENLQIVMPECLAQGFSTSLCIAKQWGTGTKAHVRSIGPSIGAIGDIC